MNLELQLEGQEANERALFDLQDWIKRERIEGLQIQRKSSPPAEGQMGADVTAILSIVLGSTAVVQLVKSIHIYLQTRAPKQRKVKIKLKVNGNELEIDGENVDEQAIIEKAEKFTKILKNKL